MNNGTLTLTLTTDEVYIEHQHWRPQLPLAQIPHTICGVLGLMIMICSVSSDIIIIVIFSRFRSLRTYSNLFVLNLTVADFLLSIGNIPMFVISSFCGTWVFGFLGCKVYAFIGSLASFVSINTLATIAVERCLVIIKLLPVQNRISRKSFILTVCFIWLYSIAWAITPLFGFGNYILEGTNTSCTFDFLTRTTSVRVYVIGIFIAHFVIPVIIISCSYYLIYKTVVRHKREFTLATQIHGESEVPLCLRKTNTGLSHEAKIARVSIIVILVFCISWTPYAIVALIGEFGDVALVTRLSTSIPCLLAKFSTVINPLLYALLHPRFRIKLVNLGVCVNLSADPPTTITRVIQFRSQRRTRQSSKI